MHAQTQYNLSAADLQTVLALARAGTFALAIPRNSSSVRRRLRCSEKSLTAAKIFSASSSL